MLKPTKEDITSPNAWIAAILSASLMGGGNFYFDNDDQVIAAEVAAAQKREQAQWEQIAKKSDKSDTREYIDLKIQALCR